MKKIVLILCVFILFGCASSTLIRSIPDGAKVKQEGVVLGLTPFDYWDRSVSFAEKKFTLQRDGYKDKDIVIRKDVFYISRLFSPPILALPWLFGYNDLYFFELEESVTPPVNWPKINKTESDFRQYLDENVDRLNPIEGIWTVTETATWRNIYSGMHGAFPELHNSYRIAIIQDSAKSNYDFVCVVLEAQNPYWEPGRIKAHLRKTAYEKVYDGLWYMRNYSEERGRYIMDESGLIKKTETSRDPNNQYVEITRQTLFIKAYPPITGKFRPSADSKLKGSASGFLLTSTGLIVTNYHVVEDANRIEIVLPEKNIIKTATIRIKDTKNDIAVLEVKDFYFSEFSNQPIPFSFADVSSVKVGQEVFTLGFPLGDIMGAKSRLSTGRINSQFGIQDDPRLFQISNPLQPGNSGGPLFNTKGELVGIVVSGLNAKYFYENTGIIPQNVNFAVKANYLQSLISMVPYGDEVTKRKNIVKTGPMENQIEQLNPFIVQIRTY